MGLLFVQCMCFTSAWKYGNKGTLQKSRKWKYGIKRTLQETPSVCNKVGTPARRLHTFRRRADGTLHVAILHTLHCWMTPT